VALNYAGKLLLKVRDDLVSLAAVLVDNGGLTAESEVLV
jgi:hypothetical protein